jgi:hypothetical protein
MLFELAGKRKTFIRIIYSLLAALFMISFVGFGIGSDAAGGLFDAIGIGGGGGHGGGTSASSPQYEAQIKDAEERLEQNPNDERAYLEISRAFFLSGQGGLEQDDHGNVVVSDEARGQLEASVDAWESYLDLEPDELDTGAARLVRDAYLRIDDPAGAVEAQRLLVKEDPSASNLGDLAFFLYSALEFKQADKVSQRAIGETPKADREALEQQLDQIAEQARAFERQQADAAEGAVNPLESPLSGAGGG